MKATRPRFAFTLIELLVSISVITVLLAILLPALAGARVSAGSAGMLSNLRGIGVSVEIYTQAHDGLYPFHNPEESYLFSPPDGPISTISTSDPWAMRINWPCAFHSVAPWREHFRSWMNPGRAINDRTPWRNGNDEFGGIVLVSYHYSCSFQARPEAWPVASDGVPSGDPVGLLLPTRAPEVASNSSKCLMYDADRAYLRRDARASDPRGVLLADGSAALRPDSAAAAPVQNRVNDRSPSRFHDTPMGVRGRDY